jgi:imidazolonepropionase-like amidohydrolase
LRSTVIKAGRLIDGTGGPAIENAILVVEGDRIPAVGGSSSVQVPRDARTVDLTNETVMPGLVNGHDHPTIRALNTGLQGQLDEMAEQPAVQAARGVHNLRADLLLGVTTESVIGEVSYNDDLTAEVQAESVTRYAPKHTS